MTIEQALRFALLVCILPFAYEPIGIAAQTPTCKRESIDAIRAAVQSLDASFIQKKSLINGCPQFYEEANFWLAFYGDVSSATRQSTDLFVIESKTGTDRLLSEARDYAIRRDFSNARIRYESFLARETVQARKVLNEQAKIENLFTIVWEGNYFDAEKEFSKFLTAPGISATAKSEALRGQALAKRLQPSNAPIMASSPQPSVKTESSTASQWRPGVILRHRRGSDTLRITSAEVGIAKSNSLRFSSFITRVTHNEYGDNQSLTVPGVGVSSSYEYGQGMRLSGALRVESLDSTLFSGELGSWYHPDKMIGLGVEVSRASRYATVALSESESDLSANAIAFSATYAEMMRATYKILQEDELPAWEQLNIKLKNQFSTNVYASIVAESITRSRPTPYYSSLERIATARVIWDLGVPIAVDWVGRFGFGAGVVQITNWSGGTDQSGVWEGSVGIGGPCCELSLVSKNAGMDAGPEVRKRELLAQFSSVWNL